MATAEESAADTKDENGIDCLLCFKTLQSPRLLPCFHSFCEKCLSEFIQSHAIDDYFSCPICNVEMPPFRHKNKSKKQEWASEYPTDEMALSVMEALNGNEEDNCCTACKRVDETCEAELWCVDCKDKICSSCNHNHKRVKSLAQHEIVSLDAKEALRGQKLKLTFEHNCNCSRRKKVEFFCINHRAMLCVCCSGIDHRKCEDVYVLDDVADIYDNRNTIKMNIPKDIKKMQTSVENLKNNIQKNEARMKSTKDTNMKSVNDIYDNLIKVINRSRLEVTNEIEYKCKKIMTQNCQKHQACIKRFSTNLNNFEHISNAIQSYGTAPQRLIADEILIKALKSHYMQLRVCTQEEKVPILDFDITYHIQDIQTIVSSFQKQVKVSSFPAKSSWEFILDMDSIMETLGKLTLISPTVYAAQFPKSKAYTCIKQITLEDVGHVFFSGGTFLADGRLLMADFHGARLLEFDSDYNYRRQHWLDGKPRDVTKGTYDNQIYISMGDYIYRCTVETKLMEVVKIKAPKNTWGIGILPDGVMVCGSTNGTITVLSPNCTMAIFTISVPRNVSGARSYYVAGSSKKEQFFYQDGKCIIGKTAYEECVFSYLSELHKPVGMSVDIDDNVYVCDNVTGNIHQLSREGNLIQVIPCMDSPWTVVVHPHNRDIVVSRMHTGENPIPLDDLDFEVYRMI